MFTPTPAATPTPNLPAELTVAPAALKGLQIEFWHPWYGKTAQALTGLVERFNRENAWGIRVTAVAAGGPDALRLAIEQTQPGDETPAVIAAQSSQLAGWADSGRLVDLSVYLTSAEWGLDPTLFAPAFLTQDRLGEQQFGLPALRTAYGLVYNRTWAQELGFSTPPLTPAALNEQACAAAKVNNRSPYLEMRGTGGWMIRSDAWSALTWWYAFGADPLPAAPDQPYRFDSPQALKALEFLRSMQAAGCLWDPRLPDPEDYFARRTMLFYTAPLNEMEALRRALAREKSKDEWVVLGFPAQDGQVFALSEGESYALTRGAPESRLAGWLFVRWLSDPSRAAGLAQAAGEMLPFASGYGLPSEAAGLARVIRPLPAPPDWRLAARPLSDAFWQTFRVVDDKQLTGLLSDLDELVAEETRR